MMEGTAYLLDIEFVVRDIRNYKQQKSPIKVTVDKYNILNINGHPICKMDEIKEE